MNDILKQRLVGALILVALGVVFWPIIFVEPGDEEVAGQRGIPPRLGVSMDPVAAPDQVGLRASPEIAARRDAPEIEPMPEPEFEPEPVSDPEPPAAAARPANDTREDAPEALALDADGVPVAWTLRVASVSSKAKAEDLRDRLQAMGHKAYIKNVKSGDRYLYRVAIGPKFERARLENIREDVDKAVGVKSIIARYVP